MSRLEWYLNPVGCWWARFTQELAYRLYTGGA